METLAARIEAVLARLGVSARELSRRAGLHETQVSLVLSRLKKNPDSEVSVPTMKAIARGAGVSEAWLLTGRGSPDDRDDHVQPAPPDEVDVAGRRPVAQDAARTAPPSHRELAALVLYGVRVESRARASVARRRAAREHDETTADVPPRDPFGSPRRDGEVRG